MSHTGHLSAENAWFGHWSRTLDPPDVRHRLLVSIDWPQKLPSPDTPHWILVRLECLDVVHVRLPVLDKASVVGGE